VVLCDRYTDATFAYQGAGRGFDLAVLSALESWVQATADGTRQPDLTLWFDLDPAVAAGRVAAARTPDRFEQQDEAFFRRVRDGYRKRAAAAPQRFARIDAAQPREQVAAQIVAMLQERGW
nr:dTMP kinase [Methylibium sp.]